MIKLLVFLERCCEYSCHVFSFFFCKTYSFFVVLFLHLEGGGLLFFSSNTWLFFFLFFFFFLNAVFFFVFCLLYMRLRPFRFARDVVGDVWEHYRRPLPRLKMTGAS